MSDMREKVKEYIKELDKEIKICEEVYIKLDNCSDNLNKNNCMGRLNALTEVRNDLQSRLEELI